MEEFGGFDNDLFTERVTKDCRQPQTYSAKQYERHWFAGETRCTENEEINRLKFAGNWLYREQKYEQALQSFLAAAALSRVEEKDIAESISRCHAQLRHHQEALAGLTAMNEGARNFDQVTAVLHLSVFIYKKLDMFYEAEKCLQQLCVLHSCDPALWSALADNYAVLARLCQDTDGSRLEQNSKPFQESVTNFMQCGKKLAGRGDIVKNGEGGDIIEKSCDSIARTFCRKCQIKNDSGDNRSSAPQATPTVCVGNQADKNSLTPIGCAGSQADKDKGPPTAFTGKDEEKDTRDIAACTMSQADNGPATPTACASSQAENGGIRDCCVMPCTGQSPSLVNQDVTTEQGHVTRLPCRQVVCLYRAQQLLKAVEKNLRSFAVERNKTLQEKVEKNISEVELGPELKLRCFQHVQSSGKESEADMDDKQMLSLLPTAKNLFEEKWFSWIHPT